MTALQTAQRAVRRASARRRRTYRIPAMFRHRDDCWCDSQAVQLAANTAVVLRAFLREAAGVPALLAAHPWMATVRVELTHGPARNAGPGTELLDYVAAAVAGADRVRIAPLEPATVAAVLADVLSWAIETVREDVQWDC